MYQGICTCPILYLYLNVCTRATTAPQRRILETLCNRLPELFHFHSHHVLCEASLTRSAALPLHGDLNQTVTSFMTAVFCIRAANWSRKAIRPLKSKHKGLCVYQSSTVPGLINESRPA
ncbi:hypothetical protein DUNSADRAFT_16274 [Dunaliella salina]|uniref:Encoded protein n=1 Tax=Dunaliella salina TaxID=3046 RepID=A0ABQ7G3X5_DUNSA|nr:hypothetical protein DUNSADRAFT_16274 [Dunaliella salina]|eukprot:KAF5829316.1 hypothetical protein DUNSADRAFT_16274 [Dunaliella salina]